MIIRYLHSLLNYQNFDIKDNVAISLVLDEDNLVAFSSIVNKKFYGEVMDKVKKFKYTNTISTSDIIKNIKQRIKNNTL